MWRWKNWCCPTNGWKWSRQVLQDPSLQRRLPGVRFEAPAQAPDDALPRMDIGFFVGFAASGPLLAPVAVESLAEFETVFGSGMALARDSAGGAPLQGLLHPAVRGFFSQGGRRCWVLRVAGAGARSSRFGLPGLLAAQRAGPGSPWRLMPATLRARSPGSGADTVRVASRVSTTPLRVLPLASPPMSSPGQLACLLPAGAVVRMGELARLELGALQVHGYVASVEAQGDDTGAGQAQLIVLAGLLALRAGHGDAPPAAPNAIGLLELDDAGGATLATLPAHGAWLDAKRLAVRVSLRAPRLPQPGDTVRLAFDDGGAGWMTLDTIELTEAVGTDGRFEAMLTGAPWHEADSGLEEALDAWRAGGQERVLALLRLDLRAGGADGNAATLHGLGMAQAADIANVADNVFTLPDDERVFGNAAPSPLAQEAARRDALGHLQGRFPLASEAQEGERLLLPLAGLDDFNATLGALASPAVALERDGLTDFHWSLFAEPTLAACSSDVLADRAEALRAAGHALQPLRGMHALFGADPIGFIDEPSLLAVPDAVHPGWRRIAQPAAAWTELAPLPEPPAPTPLPTFSDCAAVPLAPPRFVRGADPLADGRFTLYWTEPPAYAGHAEYELQEAVDAGFASAATIHRGTGARFDAPPRKPGVAYYRVRAWVRQRAGAAASPWSAPVRIEIGAQGYESVPWQPANLLAIHRLMLRSAAARGDVLAVLALPFDFDVGHSSAYAGALCATRSERAADVLQPAAIGEDELRTLSHGTLNHPWLVIRRDQDVIAFPPDGSVCGQLAAGALERGAWIAVANRPLRDVVALGPPGMHPTVAQRQAMFDAQINLLRSAPAGVVMSSSDTLSPHAEWRPVNVRRLMCLLHRMALRRGMTYVFEPNGATLRRTVERSFEGALDALFQRGAFAGDRADAAYRVNVDDRIDTAQRRDAGQFWIELQVAPALPLQFLTVRLAQNGERVLSREIH